MLNSENNVVPQGVEIFNVDIDYQQSFPLCTSKVAAGAPFPIDDHSDCKIDLNKYLIKNTAATFFVKTVGDSMSGAGIYDGDLLVVDRSLQPQNGKIVIAIVNGEFTVKRLLKLKDKVILAPENSKYQAIKITPEIDCTIWGVVTSVVHTV